MEGMYRFVLTDVERAHWTESWTIDESTLPLGTEHTWRVPKNRPQRRRTRRDRPH